MLRVLRRRTEITVSVAPRLAPAVDIRVADEPVVPPPRADVAMVPSPTVTPFSAPAAAPSLPPSPPSYTPGVCYHPVHVDLEGERYGVLPEAGYNPSRASLTRCHHLNPDGRQPPVIPLTLHLDCEQHPLPTDNLAGDGMLTDIGLLRHGTVGGKATVGLIITLPDGGQVLGQTTWALLRTAFAGLSASPIVAEEVIDP